MLNCRCQNSIVKNLQASKFISSTITKIVAFNTIEDKHSRIEQIDEEIAITENSRYQRINYISELSSNRNYKWIKQNAYKLYKSKDINHYLVVLHLMNINSKGFTILFSHGNSVTLGNVYPLLFDLSSTLKCNVICYDYSGYGYSKGTPSEEEVYNDIEEVGTFALRELKILSDELILMGHSLGTAPTVHLANNPNYYNVAGLVLISPLASGMSLLLGGEELKKKNPKDVFNNKDIIGRIISPIFLIHGRKDSTIPVEHSIELAKHIQNLYKWYPKKAGHNNIISELRMKFFQKCKFFMDYLSRFQNKRCNTSDNKIYSCVIRSNEPYYKNIYASRMIQREENYMISNTNINNNSNSVKLDSCDNYNNSKDKSFCTLKQDDSNGFFYTIGNDSK